MDLSVVLEPFLGVEEDATTIVGSRDGVLASGAKVGCRDEVAAFRPNLVPQRHLFLWNVPQAQLAVKGPREEVLVVPGMEGDCGDKVLVQETCEAFDPRHVPQSNRLVHGRREKKRVPRVAPRQVKHVRSVPFVFAEGLLAEGKGGGHCRAGRCIAPCRVLKLVLNPDCHPHPHHLVLPCSGQQAAARRHLHRPDGPNVFPAQVLDHAKVPEILVLLCLGGPRSHLDKPGSLLCPLMLLANTFVVASQSVCQRSGTRSNVCPGLFGPLGGGRGRRTGLFFQFSAEPPRLRLTITIFVAREGLRVSVEFARTMDHGE
mmetsp:Transcript_34033/g.89338  ORF Transcript_34033/g.89338 Transcript_34033/m.89338 type:complete len:316 (+) Transcript_34033:5334-6281(+)